MTTETTPKPRIRLKKQKKKKVTQSTADFYGSIGQPRHPAMHQSAPRRTWLDDEESYYGFWYGHGGQEEVMKAAEAALLNKNEGAIHGHD